MNILEIIMYFHVNNGNIFHFDNMNFCKLAPKIIGFSSGDSLYFHGHGGGGINALIKVLIGQIFLHCFRKLFFLMELCIYMCV